MKRYRGQGLGGGVTLILAIVIFPVVWFTLANEAEMLYREDGQEAPISTLWGLWFLLPIIGSFVWYLRMQRVLNEFWATHGGAAARDHGQLNAAGTRPSRSDPSARA